MPYPIIDRARLLAELEPLPRLLRIEAPAGYGKTTLARALLSRSASTAICDLSNTETSIDVVRSTVGMLAARTGEAWRAPARLRAGSIDGEECAWLNFGQRYLRKLKRPQVLCFDGGEMIEKREGLGRAIEALLRHADQNLRVIICSRETLGSSVEAFAGPNETRLLEASDLRFDADEIRRLFATAPPCRTTIERIATVSGGWPVIVAMLRDVAERGDLDHCLLGRDESKLDGYLAREVVAALGEAGRIVSAGTMLDAFVRRTAEKTRSARARAVVDLTSGIVTIDGRDVRLSEREAQLVTLLALRGTIHADDIVDILWPEFEGDRAAASLKVYVSRLRRLAGDRSFVVHQPHGYRLCTPPSVIRGPVVATRFSRWGWVAGAS